MSRAQTNSPPAPTRVDPGIALATGLLVAIGVVMSYSATAALALDRSIPPLFFDHLVGLILGAIAGAAAYRMPASVLQRSALPFYALTIALLVATLAFGVRVNGAQRWVDVLGLRFQPGELAKCATLLAVAAWLSRPDDRRELSTRRSIQAAGLALLPAGLLLMQPDLGLSLIHI